MVNFGIEMFRTYGTQDLVMEIPVRHMNVTDSPDFYREQRVMPESAKQLIRGDILCRLPLGNGHKGDVKNRPREILFRAKSSIRTKQNPSSKK